MNIHGQTGLSCTKQTQIESFISKEKIDILHLQEVNIDEDSFSTCHHGLSNYNLISNNSPTGYGTASLIKSDLIPANIQFDSSGRIIMFDIGPLTLANLYLPSGTDSPSRTAREHCAAETLPQLLLNRKDAGLLGGDLNCILDKKDCTYNPTSKMSPSLSKLVNTCDMFDVF